MRRTVLIGIGVAVLGAAVAAWTAARAGDEGRHETRKVVIFRSGGSWLGVQIADVDQDHAKEIGLKEVMGAEVQAVVPDSPAEAAGIKEGDVITEYQGSRIEGVAQLTRLVSETPAGRTASVKVFRDGAVKTFDVKMSERSGAHEGAPGGRVKIWDDEDGDMHEIDIPPSPKGPHPGVPPMVDLEGLQDKLRALEGVGGGRPRLGVTVDTVGKQLADYFGVKQGSGVLVTSIGKGSPGEAAGLKAGDVIVKVDDEAVEDAGDLHLAMRDRRDKDFTLTVVRDRREQTLHVSAPDPKTLEPRHGAHGAPAGMTPEMRRQWRDAMRQARAAQVQAQSDARRAYEDALRQAHEVTKEALQGAAAAAAAARDAAEEAVQDEGDSGDDGDETSQVETPPAPGAPDPGATVDVRKVGSEERDAIRRAVEEARRIRLEMQQGQ